MDDVITNRIEFKGIFDIDLKHVFECGQCFRWEDEKGDGVYTGVVGDYLCRASQRRDDDGSSAIMLDVSGGDEDFWYEYLDLGTDYREIKKFLCRNNDEIRPAVKSCGGIRILKQDFYETLISFIISQNNNIPRIKKCIESMCKRFGEPLGEFDGRIRYAFPKPEVVAAADEEVFVGMKFGYRSAYMPTASAKFLEEGLPTGNMAEKKEKLLKYAGVGPKVAACIMLYALRDTASFPIDTWVKHFMNDLYGIDEKNLAGMARKAEEMFGEYGGYAQQYLFYYYRG